MIEQRNSPGAPRSRNGSRPLGIKILIAVNFAAAAVLLLMVPHYSGGRALLYLCVGLLHGLLGIGLYLRQNWARIVMIVYALFQSVGMALWSLIGLMTLMAEPLDADKAAFLAFSAVAIPFLFWAGIYLLRHMTNGVGSSDR